jgi:cysteine desulfurase/selenocysteine lyase
MSGNTVNIRDQFPVLRQEVYGRPLIYFDNAATSQKPKKVIDAISAYYLNENSNIHRGAHYLSNQATEKYEKAREAVRRFIRAKSTEEIILTKGSTESINLVASCLSRFLFKPGDEILVSGLEHHANIVPWQIAAEQTGAQIKVIPVLDSGELDIQVFNNLLSENTKLLALSHISNALGTIIPVEEMISMAKEKGALVLLDGAQSAPHVSLDMEALDCDFFCFSAHKIYGPTGIGVLYGKKALLQKMPPYQSGGEMIKEVSFSGTTFNDLPYKFEAGTPNIAGGVGLLAAIEFIEEVGMEKISQREAELLAYATKKIKRSRRYKICWRSSEKSSRDFFSC